MDTSSSGAVQDDNQRVFRNDPLTLQDLASIKVAFYMHTSKFDTEILAAVPSVIRNMVELKFRPIVEEFECWFKSSDHISCYLGDEDIYRRYPLVVFGGNGTVHFKATIANFLEDETLPNITKYEMACVYCVEEKVKEFWPLVCNTIYVNHNMPRDHYDDRDYVMYYWVCKMKDELNILPSLGYDCIEHAMIDKCGRLGYWLAVEYFLNMLHPDDRIVEIYRLIRNSVFFNFEYLVPYFEGRLQRVILKKRPISTVFNLILKYNTIKYGIQACIHIRDFVPTEKYYTLIFQLIVIRNANKTRSPFRYMHAEIVLSELWFNATDHLKKYILNQKLSDILLLMADYQPKTSLLKNFSRDIRFVLTLLSEANGQLRKAYWSYYWHEWMIGVPLSQFEELMKLCLENAKSIEQFKRALKNTRVIHKYLDDLITRGYHLELNEVICYVCCSDQNDVFKMKKSSLEANLYWKEAIFSQGSLEDIEKYAKFVDDVFLNDAQAKDYKERLVLSKSSLKMLNEKIDCNDLMDIQTMIDLYVSSSGKKSGVKKQLLKLFRTKIVNGKLYQFDASDWTNFLNWCLNDDKPEIKKFLNSLPICDIFQAAFSCCLSNKFQFEDLNNFLRWYFESTRCCMTFLRERIRFYQQMDHVHVKRIFSVNTKKFVIDSLKDQLLVFQ